MPNIFTKSNDATPKPNRNTFDGSFVNNLTLKMGQITPCFCKEVIPGDSFRINPTFGFNFQPFVFPVQTDMQANLHFFYVRNRALWKGWMDFITKTENLDGDSTPPYIMLTEENRDMFETGKIGDYLGVPTIKYGSDAETLFYEFKSYEGNSVNRIPFYASPAFTSDALLNQLSDAVDSRDIQQIRTALGGMMKNVFDGFFGSYKHSTTLEPSETLNYTQFYFAELPPNVYKVNVPKNSVLVSSYSANYVVSASDLVSMCLFDMDTYEVLGYYVGTYGSSVSLVYNFDTTQSGYNFFEIDKSEGYNRRLGVLFVPYVTPRNSYSGGLSFVYDGSVLQDATIGVSNSDQLLQDLPFVSGGNQDGIRISALPFRAVEACYNAFYRDDRNNPLIIDGKPYYNVYVQDKTGGADINHYHLYQRNWEADVFTTAVQSPQQGVAPLVGVTASGQMTFQDEEGKTYYLQAEFGDDGHTITGIKSYSSDMPVGTLRAMVDTISTGISINDFRNVNAFQRWLETNMRKGLRYKDQIEAHFGTAPTYSELDMPEFIGGMSRRVEVNKVVQTSADTPTSPLGTLGGNATILGGDGADISCYADEHGWIIGFITITPKPVYSQQLNKQLLKTQLLDYYFPEFAHIGFQPILNQEIAPLQCRGREGERLTDVFGYQRAWYEYLANVDEVHGDFRTTLKDYIIHRVFNGVPQLSEDFLTVSTEEANEVFAVQDDSDKIFGQIYFDVKMKRPLPTVGVPKLEVG